MRMGVVRVISVLCLGIAVSACDRTRNVERQIPAVTSRPSPAVASRPSPAVASRPSPTERPRKPVSEIDISKIGQITPKGRVQDKEYSQLEVIDQLIANGKDSIPFLISKLEDGTIIQHHVIDYWPGPITVGDVAFVILSDFTTDHTWTKTTIPEPMRTVFLGKYDPNLPGVERLTRFVQKHGRKPIRRKWEEIWSKYKDQIVWDEQERCFKLV